jgi:CRP-like cAMP-binding protein
MGKFKKRVGELNADAHLLDRLEGLSWLEPEKRNVFAQKLKLVALKSRSQIFVTGTSADQAYVVLRGLVQVGEPGSSLTSIVGPGEICGLSGLVPGQPDIFFYRDLSESSIGVMSAEDFFRIVFGVEWRNVRLLLDFVFKKWWGGAIPRVFHSNGLTLEHRLNRALREIGERVGVRDSRGVLLGVAITHQVLGELIGASRPKVTGTIRKLIRSGKILSEHRRLILVDRAADPRPTTPAPRAIDTGRASRIQSKGSLDNRFRSKS